MTTSELGYLLLGFGIGTTTGYLYVAWRARKYFLALQNGVVEDLLQSEQNLAAQLDKQNGTPCEQVRHKDEIETMRLHLGQAIADTAFHKKRGDEWKRKAKVWYAAYNGQDMPEGQQ